MAVADAVHVHFGGVVQEPVDEDGVFGGGLHGQFMKLMRAASSETISMARPPRTKEGRTSTG